MLKYLVAALTLLAPAQGTALERELTDQGDFCGTFTRVVLLGLLGKPGRYTDDETNLIEQALLSVYNQLSDCDQYLSSVDFLTDSPNPARRLSVGLGTEIQPFTLAVGCDGYSCRGCNYEPSPLLYAASDSSAASNSTVRELTKGLRGREDTRDLYYRSRRSRRRSKRRRSGRRPRPPIDPCLYGTMGSGSSSSSDSCEDPGTETAAPTDPAFSCGCEPPTNEAILAALNDAFIARELDSVETFTELATDGECNRTEFGTPAMSFTITGDPSLLSVAEVEIWNAAFTEVYNSINVFGPETCDPYYRILVGDVDTAASGITSTGLTATVTGSGTCSGCPETMGLFSLGRRLEGEKAVTQYSRNLVDLNNDVFETYCFCPPDALPRAPTREEFVDALNAKIEVLRAEGEISFIELVS